MRYLVNLGSLGNPVYDADGNIVADDGSITATPATPSIGQSLTTLAANVAATLAPKVGGVPVTVGLAPSTVSVISLALFGIGGLILISMMRSK